MYNNAIIKAVKEAGKPLRHRDLVMFLAPEDKGHKAFSAIGMALTQLYRAGFLAREKCDGYYHYTIARPETEDEAAFGRNAWVYCRQHMNAHQTGWCTIPPYDKIGLGVKTAQEAIDKCREWKLPLYADRNND